MDPQSDSSPNAVEHYLGKQFWQGVGAIAGILALLLTLGNMAWELITGNVQRLLWLQATAYMVPLSVGVLFIVAFVAAYVILARHPVLHAAHRYSRNGNHGIPRIPRFSNRTRSASGIIGLLSIAIALVTTVGYDNWARSPRSQTIVLVADFADPSGIDGRYLTRDLVHQIGDTLVDYHNEIQIRALGWNIEDNRGEGSADAKRVGQLAKADIIIWGDYHAEPDFAAYIHFDLLNSPSSLLAMESNRVYGDDLVQQVAAQQLALPKSYAFNVALGDHMGSLVAYAAGLTLAESGAYAESVPFLDTASEVYGSPLATQIEPAIHFTRGTAYSHLGKYPIALAEMTAALGQLSSSPSLAQYITPAIVLNNLGLIRSDMGDMDGAIGDYNEAILDDPDYAPAYSNRGLVWRDKGDLTKATSDLERAIELDPSMAAAYNNRGTVRNMQGNISGASSDYDRAIVLDPQHLVAYINRGALRDIQGDQSGALSDYDRAIALNPQFAPAYNNRGIVLHEQGDLMGATRAYSQAIAIEPGFAIAYNNRGSTRLELGDLTAAIDDYSQAIKLNPKFATAYFDRGSTHYRLGHQSEALSDLDQAITLDPNYALAYYNRGILRSDRGDLPGARTDYDQALVIDPKMVAAYYNRGTLRGEQGDLAGAINDFNQAIVLDPENVDAYFNRGTARSDYGDLSGALSDLVHYLELSPSASDRTAVEEHIKELKDRLDVLAQ